MTDYSELKRLAEAARDDQANFLCFDERYMEAVNPQCILALIAENERLSGECEGCPMSIAEALRIERDQLKAENERLHYAIQHNEACFRLELGESERLRKENEALRKGIDPAWSLMDQSLLIDHLRLNTNFAADKVGAMIQFAVECAQYVELHPSRGDKSGG